MTAGPRSRRPRRRRWPARFRRASRSVRGRARGQCGNAGPTRQRLEMDTARLVDLVPNRRDALEVARDGAQIGRGHVLVAGECALDVAAHQPAGHVAVGAVARSEVGDDLLLGPVSDPGGRVGGDVGCRLAFGAGPLRVAREQARTVHRHRHGRARGMALATMADGPHEILTARETRDGRRRGRRLPGGEGGEPDGQAEALEHRDHDLLRGVGAMHRWDGAEERHKGLEVLLGHAVERRERVHRQQTLAGDPSAEPDGGDDLLVRPGPDPGLSVRRDIGRVDRPEGALELLAARVRLPLGLGVAAAAGRRAEDVLAPRDVGGAGGPGRADGRGHEADRENQALHGTCANATPCRWFHGTARLFQRYARREVSARLGGMRTLRILVVDDQEHMRELLVEALSADGHTVDPAENGTAAIQLFEAHAYDLVVSDLQMPQMDGPKLYEEICKRWPAAPPGFVFITGEDEAPGYRQFLKDSKLPVVAKPFKLKEFRQLLGTLFPPA